MRIVRVRAVIPYEGKYLFVKQRRDSSFWALPGGRLEEGEGLQSGLARELYEELGVRAVIGRLLYVQQLLLDGQESLEFFFEVTNGEDFLEIDLGATTHGKHELTAFEFINPADERVLPDFLSELDTDREAEDMPKVFTRL